MCSYSESVSVSVKKYCFQPIRIYIQLVKPVLTMQTALNETNDLPCAANKPMQLLFVDDDSDYLDLISRQMSRRYGLSYQSDRANSICQAVKLCVTNTYDCVVVDYHLPDGYGTDIVDRLNENDALDSMSRLSLPPIIVVSGDGGEQAATQAIRAGAVDFIAKRDITGAAMQRAIQHAVDKSRLTVSLEKRNEELESKRREVLEFYHTLSHEVKTPLASAREFVALVRDGAAGDVTEDQNELLGLAIDSCDQIRQHFMDLLEITRFDSQKFKLNKESQPLEHIIKRSMSGVAELARERNIELTTIGYGSQLHVWCDPQRIVQVLSNLLSNAIKFTLPGGWVRLDTQVHREAIVFEVSDNGCGIRRSDQAAIFNRLYQVEQNDGQLDDSGLGLGLNITRDILAHHGAELTLSSEWGVGSSFRFSLPIYQS